MLVGLINKPAAMLNHLIHSAFLEEMAISIAEHAVVFIPAAVSIRAEDSFGKRHPATLTETLFHSSHLVILKK